MEEGSGTAVIVTMFAYSKVRLGPPMALTDKKGVAASCTVMLTPLAHWYPGKFATAAGTRSAPVIDPIRTPLDP